MSVKKNHSFFAMFFLILFTPIQGCISPEIGDDFRFVITNTSDNCERIMEIESDFENIGPFQKGWWANASRINETTWNADWSIGDGVCDDYWFEKKTADMFDRNNSTYTHLYHPYLEINNKSMVEVGTEISFYIRETWVFYHGMEAYNITCTVTITQEHLDEGNANCQ